MIAQKRQKSSGSDTVVRERGFAGSWFSRTSGLSLIDALQMLCGGQIVALLPQVFQHLPLMAQLGNLWLNLRRGPGHSPLPVKESSAAAIRGGVKPVCIEDAI